MTSINFIGTNHGLQIGNNYGTAQFHQPNTTEDIDRLCLQNLNCPDSLVVKNRLKEAKDKLLRESFEWIFQDPQYRSWRDGSDVCLLWIKGGAGKGKTMMSIGLIEELSRVRHETARVTYFFCQNADNKLNTLEFIIKGLILKLMSQQIELKESLRRRWDTKNDRFNEDVTSWRTLWTILFEMLDRCNAPKIYIIVDALDECHDSCMAEFLQLIVRNGLDHPAKIKWLLTSRPLEAAERALLAAHDQVQVSLELNSKFVSQAVRAYVSYKVDELSRRSKYGETLRREMKAELTSKAEGTFLWVSLVCKKLENVRQDEALATIQNLPPGLHPFYDRILHQLSQGEPDDVQKCMRLLRAMTLVYRPLKVEEVSSLTGLTNEDDAIKALVNRCASFLWMQKNNVEFIHQSARDYLAGDNGQSLLDAHVRFGHPEIASRCLSQMSKWLQINLGSLPRPDSTRESWKPLKKEKQHVQLSCLDYASTFWVQHLESIKQSTILQSSLMEQGVVGKFLRKRLLEWLECLSLFNRLPRAIQALEALGNIAKDNPSTLALVQDATRFLLRHYHTLDRWPLQIYSSAIVFSPETSVVKMENLDKIPVYLRKAPPMDRNWTSTIQTLEGHSDAVDLVVFSPDGTQIASGSSDNTIKLWDTTTGDLQKTLEGHSAEIIAVIFSPDSKRIVSGSDDNTIKLWDNTTGDLQKTLEGHSDTLTIVDLSPDGKHIASGTVSGTVKLWGTATGELQKTLVGHSKRVLDVAFSPDGKQIASYSNDKTIKLWDTTTGDLQKTLVGHSDGVWTIKFSPDGKQLASFSEYDTIKLWDTTTGDLQKTLEGHSDRLTTVDLSPDGKHIASGTVSGTVKLWDTATGDFQKTLEGHSDVVELVVFSPDGTQIASCSSDNTIKLWDTTTGDLQKTLVGHSEMVTDVAFSPDGKQIVSGSIDDTIKLWDIIADHVEDTLEGHSSHIWEVDFSPDGTQIASCSSDNTIKLWDTTTGDLQKTLVGHSEMVTSVAFSPDGKQIVSGSGDNTIKLWDATTGDLQKTLVGHSEMVATVIFSPDSTQIASGSGDNTIKLWDTTTGGLQKTLVGHSQWVATVAFSPDGKQIASGSHDNTIKLWDPITGSLQKTLVPVTALSSFGTSPNLLNQQSYSAIN
ncbi:G-protein beta WD- 40 repeats containing protein [Penicillium brevicompactum]|uniref:G-protein beta WD- 40 repeats containing protein n=1 Tax=Penicillium brevicompactum TaxID=5074 RepID=UPI002541D21B|nr:G-protein beta WD- 40 repeats containing protein [Penicillium brevicompactum]KAJ5348532.1 G-protein beta WD- 40 repeats containing protein [Penicillium brevicompactum]